MSPTIATFIFVVVILGLFWLDRNREARPSVALWIPVTWLWIVCSRPVSQWFLLGPPIDAANQVLEGSPSDRLAYMGLMVIGLIVLSNRTRRIGSLLRANWAVLFFFLYCAVSLLWSDYPDVAFKRWTKAIGDLVMVLIVLSELEPLAAIKRLLARTTYLLIPLSVLFIKYYPSLGRGYGDWGGEVYYTGVTTNKNTLGAICLFFGLGALWRFLAAYQDRQGQGRIHRMIASGVILVMVLWLFRLTNSMTAFSSFMMASCLLLVANLRAAKRRPAVVHVFIASMVAVSISVLFLGASPDALKTLGRNPTLTGRTEVWGHLLSLVQNPVFGTGFESFWLGPRLEKMWTLYWWHPNQAHNGYLEVFLNLGWIGVALLVLVLAKGYRTVFSAWRGNIPMGSLWLAYFFVGLVFNCTEAAFFRLQAPAWIFFLLAIASAPALSYSKIRPAKQDPELLSRVEERPAFARSSQIKIEQSPL
jgi:exopolysaccharide production protein ExoQ